MDRIHRLGQHRPVQAIKLVIEDSIESRIVQLQEKKSAMVDATVGFFLVDHALIASLNHCFTGSCQPMTLQWAASHPKILASCSEYVTLSTISGYVS